MTRTPMLHRRAALALLAALSTMLIGIAGSTAAFWSAQTSISSTVRTPSISITAQDAGTLTQTLINSTLDPTNTDNLVTPRLATTGSVTLSNTGGVSGTATLSIGAAPAAGLAVAASRTVWLAAPTCGTGPPPSGATTTPWTSTATVSGIALAPGATSTYCVRTTISPRSAAAVAAGSQTFSATVGATLTAGTWTVSSAAVPLTLGTAAVFPLSTTMAPVPPQVGWIKITPATAATICADARATGVTDGTVVQSLTCGTGAGLTTNRVWRLVPVAGSADRVSIQPAHAPGIRLTAPRSTTDPLTLVTAGQASTSATYPANAAGQQWWVQERSTGVYQLVSAETGLCASMSGTGGTALGLAPCTSATTVALQAAPIAAPTMAASILTIGNIIGASTFTFGAGRAAGAGDWTVSYVPAASVACAAMADGTNTVVCPGPATSGTYTLIAKTNGVQMMSWTATYNAGVLGVLLPSWSNVTVTG